MEEISATDAARHFSDLLDAVEHRGESFRIVRRGSVVAVVEPARRHTAAALAAYLEAHEPIPGLLESVEEVRRYVVDDTEERLARWHGTSSTPRS